MAKSKFFRVATEGATTDGRKIERDWIEQMARNFNRAKYGARVWLEHIRGIVPGGAFDALGDVVALQARDVEDGKKALYAQIEPLPALLDLNKRKQKLYTSMEVAPKFADTGEAYLTGLAVTDSPASLGTELLEFAAHASVNPLTERKSSPDALLTESVPFTLELEAEQPADESAGALRKLADMFARLIGGESSGNSAAAPAAPPAPVPPQASANTAAPTGGEGAAAAFSTALAQLTVVLQGFSAAQATTQTQLATLRAEHDALIQRLSQMPGGPGRPPATGSGERALADC
jgi:hypothetical protein